MDGSLFTDDLETMLGELCMGAWEEKRLEVECLNCKIAKNTNSGAIIFSMFRSSHMVLAGILI